MAKNGNGNGGPSAADRFKRVTGTWARGMDDGDVLVGKYLGHDQAMMNGKRGPEPRTRHHFAAVSIESTNIKTGELVTTKEPSVVIFGAVGLDVDLASVELGSIVMVKRDGKVPGKRMTNYIVAIDTESAPDEEGIIGRNFIQSGGASYGANGYR